MRHLTAEGIWRINERKARLWYSDEGLYLVWKTAAKEIISALQRDGVSGVPQDSEVILDLLCAGSVFSLGRDGGPFTTIAPPGSENDLVCVRFANPLAILSVLDEEPKRIPSVQQPKVTSSEADSTSLQGEALPVVSSEMPNSDVSSGVVLHEEPIGTPTTPPNTKGEIPGVKSPRTNAKGSAKQTEQDVSQFVPSTVASKMTPLLRDVFGALIDDQRSGSIINTAGRTTNGFAIAIGQFALYGFDTALCILELEKLDWLAIHPDRPEKKLHDVKINGKDCRAIVIKQQVAYDLGLLL
jgi:hypothetical protein